MSAVEHRFGPYGGQYVPETLMPALAQLEREWEEAWADAAFRAELDALLRDYAGRPTPLYETRRLSEAAGRRILLKREDLLHTGAHKLNNALGQALLAQRMGKRRVIAETGAGQHGVATATACALLGLDCVVYMGTEDMRRQEPNVQRMDLLGAEVAPVQSGARTLKEAVSEAIRDWVAHVEDTHYVIGSSVGPAPYPAIVRDLQRVIGDEARAQVLEREGRLPSRAAILQDDEGQILEAHSVSAGLDYPGSGPQHAHLRDTGRARYVAVTDADALAAFRRVTQLEGIIPALESSHALAWVLANAGPADGLDLVCLSGRGDKDLAEVLGFDAPPE